jgi:hypothetical protein
VSLVESARPIQLVVLVLAVTLTFGFTAEAQTTSPLAGTWKLNLAKSTYAPGPPPYKRSTCRIEHWADGLNAGLKVTYDMVGTRGGVTHLEWIGKLDGRDYPIAGVDDVLTNAYTRIDDRTYEVVVKADGAKAATARIVIAPDGRTLTSVTTTRNAQGKTLQTTIVYDRQ